MRNFTPEEKELIVNTEITPDCFEKWEDYHFESMARDEAVRRKYLQTKNKHYFDILIRLLPNSYKVVKL